MSVARQHIAALDADSLRAIETGAHATPFSVFGVHDAAGRRMLRVNAPGAWRVEARSRNDRSNLLAVLDQSQTPGLFAAPFDSETPYLLRIYWPGRVDEHEDPYSFPSAISEPDLSALRQTRRRGASDLLGAHPAVLDGVPGVRFALWAPNAASVAVAGDFNDWSERRHPMGKRGDSGVWEIFIPRVGSGARYNFALRGHGASAPVWLVDPFAQSIEANASEAEAAEDVVSHAGVIAGPLRRQWRDERFLAIRRARRDCAPPVAIYRVEPFVWLARDGRIADWRTLRERLLPFVAALGFSHIQIGRALARPPAWFFAPPPELGGRDEFAAFVDACHEAGISVIIEWSGAIPFAANDLLDTANNPLNAFAENLLSDAALNWLETFHVDGLSMKAPGASHLLSRLRDEIEDCAPGAILILEEDCDSAHAATSTWRPEAIVAVFEGEAPPLFRENAGNLEDVLLPVTPRTLARFTPDEHSSDPFALLRAVYAFVWLTPGMKLVHMGAELGQHAWPDGVVVWEKLDEPHSFGFLKLVRDLNRTLRNEAPIRLTTRVSQLLTWLPADQPVIAYLRSGEAAAPLLVVMNRADEMRRLRLGIPSGGHWRELLNTDSSHYGGGDIGNFGGAEAVDNPDRPGTFLVDISLPPRGTIIFRNET